MFSCTLGKMMFFFITITVMHCSVKMCTGQAPTHIQACFCLVDISTTLPNTARQPNSCPAWAIGSISQQSKTNKLKDLTVLSLLSLNILFYFKKQMKGLKIFMYISSHSISNSICSYTAMPLPRLLRDSGILFTPICLSL